MLFFWIVRLPNAEFNDRLPYAPSMKIYCVYGHGKETEVCFTQDSCSSDLVTYIHQRSYW